MKVEYAFEVNDYHTFLVYSYHHTAFGKKRYRTQRYGNPFSVLLVVMSCMLISDHIPMLAEIMYWFGGCTLYILGFPLWFKWYLRRYAIKNYIGKDRAQAGFMIAPEGMTMMLWHGHQLMYWHAISSIVDLDQHILFFYDPINAMVLPKRAFQDSSACATFLAQARSYYAAGRTSLPAATASN